MNKNDFLQISDNKQNALGKANLKVGVSFSRTNSKSFHYFLMKFLVETDLDELSAKIHFSGAQKARKNFPPNHLIYRGHTRKLQWLMPL